ncbi:hypothetical protein [Bacillus alkalicellulosilyticus]|uniref:hypothetical protein n=1 Tax=Alkalihalobacterium alkalicellulosilyticum TaxID=1912214 RepID=UPI0009960B8F|nr:hypothetical protein [Bacillus alkalicellulosilyticus]
MKKYIILGIVIVVTTACAAVEEADVKRELDVEVEEVSKAIPTIEERETFLKSNQYIVEYELITEDDTLNTNQMSVRMKDEFADLSISEQYLFLVDFYETFNVKFGELLPNDWDFLNRLSVFVEDNEIPTYCVTLRTFEVVSYNIGIDREVGEMAGDHLLDILDHLDKSEVLSGKEGNQEDSSPTIFSASGELIRESESWPGGMPFAETSTNSNTNDSETYIDEMTGNDWVLLTENQKFHGVSNALYHLDMNGYTIEESEYFFIEALDAFYTSAPMMDVPVSEALPSIGVMANAIRK